MRILSASDFDYTDLSINRVGLVPSQVRNGERFFLLVATRNFTVTTIGGGVESSDYNLLTALLREKQEEIGDYITVTDEMVLSGKVLVRGREALFTCETVDETGQFTPNREAHCVLWLTLPQIVGALKASRGGRTSICEKRYFAFVQGASESLPGLPEMIDFEASPTLKVPNHEAPIIRVVKSPPLEQFFYKLQAHDSAMRHGMAVIMEEEWIHIMDGNFEYYCLPRNEDSLSKLGEYSKNRSGCYFAMPIEIKSDWPAALMIHPLWRRADRSWIQRDWFLRASRDYASSRLQMTIGARLNFAMQLEKDLQGLLGSNTILQYFELTRAAIIDIITEVNDAILTGYDLDDIQELLTKPDHRLISSAVEVLNHLIKDGFWKRESSSELCF